MSQLRITDLIPSNQILAHMNARTKEGALEEMADLLTRAAGPEMRAPILDALKQREQLASTGIGEQVAIPHGKIDQLPSVLAGLARSQEGIDFGSIDGQPTHLFFVIVAPGSANGLHLRALARIARLCRSEKFRSMLLDAGQGEEMYAILRSEDERL